ncbi:MAG: PilW family protein [Gallionella sp.]
MPQPNQFSLQRPAFTQIGFTLVEIMVGLTIGMLATVVIMQVFTVFETQKRTTTGSADAQTNASIALYNISRELQNAGYPLMPSENSPLECTTRTYGATGIGDLFPVTITEGVAVAGVSSASDSITIRYGSTSMGGIPATITGFSLTPNAVEVERNFGCSDNGEIVLIVNGTTCAMTSLAAAPAIAVPPATEIIQLVNMTAATPSAEFSCLGTWDEITFRVNGGALERSDILSPLPLGAVQAVSDAFKPAIAGIVNLQAQYGISATVGSNRIEQWVDATGIWAAPLTNPAVRNRIKAVRIAVIGRTDRKETTNITTVCSSETAASPTGLCAWDATSANPNTASPAPVMDLSDDDTDWLRYRYRVFETILPIRNIIWAKDTL